MVFKCATLPLAALGLCIQLHWHRLIQILTTEVARPWMPSSLYPVRLAFLRGAFQFLSFFLFPLPEQYHPEQCVVLSKLGVPWRRAATEAMMA